MPPKNFREVGDGLDKLAERYATRDRERIKRESTDVIADVVKQADYGGLPDAEAYAALDAALTAGFERMGTEALTDSLAACTEQAALIGHTAARPGQQEIDTNE